MECRIVLFILYPGSALISVYAYDGTVLLSHGGVEMGQGLNTKMMQIASLELHIPIEMIRVSSNSTEKVYSCNPLKFCASLSSCMLSAWA